jgi:hypothetical protein
MATSGTVGNNVADVTNIIEHAYRRCGKLASTISSELQLSARENLFFLLSDLANRGLSLWCVEKQVLGINPNQIQFPLRQGTVDIMNALYRTKTDLTGTTISGAGWQGLDLGVGVTAAVYNTAIQFSVATSATLVMEYSLDSILWVQAQAFSFATAKAAGCWLSTDADNSTAARYWRVRDTSGTLASVSALTFSVSPYEIPMAKLSNDDYASLPNKTFSVPAGSKSLQYWFDKQTAPRIWIWPASQVSTDQIVIWSQRHIQDVGALTNTLDIPQRWMESIILTLACRCAVELPAGELPDGRLEYLESKAAEHLSQAEDSESDGAPIRISPNISGYTR